MRKNADIFEENGIKLNCGQLEKFEKLFKIFMEENKKYNLTSITNEKEVYIKHFVDSIKGEEFFRENSSLIEIGSGGGFPSVPLKIIRPDLKMTLVESTGKKCEYLKMIGRIFEFKNFEVVNARAEDLGKDEKYREKFDAATARAVARLNSLAEYCVPFVKKEGVFVAYKGEAEEEIKEAEKAVSTLGCEKREEKNFSLSNGYGERTIIVYEKKKPTPKIYPRGNGKERKNPII